MFVRERQKKKTGKVHWMKKRLQRSATEQTRASSRVSRIFNQMFPNKKKEKIISSLRRWLSWCANRSTFHRRWIVSRKANFECSSRRTSIPNHARQSEGRRTLGKGVRDGGSFLSVFTFFNFFPPEQKTKKLSLLGTTRRRRRRRRSAHSFIEMESSWWWCCCWW